MNPISLLLVCEVLLQDHLAVCGDDVPRVPPRQDSSCVVLVQGGTYLSIRRLAWVVVRDLPVDMELKHLLTFPGERHMERDDVDVLFVVAHTDLVGDKIADIGLCRRIQRAIAAVRVHDGQSVVC
jgi:hypothetical protein